MKSLLKCIKGDINHLDFERKKTFMNHSEKTYLYKNIRKFNEDR